MTPGDELDRDVWVRRAYTCAIVAALWICSVWFMWWSLTNDQRWCDTHSNCSGTTTTVAR